MADDGPLHFQRIDRSDLAVDDFSARSDHQRVGDRAGPLLVQGLGERVVVTCLEDVIGRRDVVLLEDPGRLGLLLLPGARSMFTASHPSRTLIKIIALFYKPDPALWQGNRLRRS